MTTDLKDVRCWVVENGKATPWNCSYPIINGSTLKDGVYSSEAVYIGEGFAGLALFRKK